VTVTRDSSEAVLNAIRSINARLANTIVRQMLTVFQIMEPMTASVQLVTRDQALNVTM
jgi:flagellar motor switch protein FliG